MSHAVAPPKKSWDSIPRFPRASSRTDVPWTHLERHLTEERSYGLAMEPDYQRGHVWTAPQRRAWVEHMLMGGETAREVILVCEAYNGAPSGRYAVADGLQRITTASLFMRGEVRIFPDALRPEGYAVGDFAGRLSMSNTIVFSTVVAKTRADELLLYLRINAGGTAHPRAELDRVRGLLRAGVAAGGALSLGADWVDFLAREAG